jgi:hypothetical protein
MHASTRAEQIVNFQAVRFYETEPHLKRTLYSCGVNTDAVLKSFCQENV